VGRAGHKVKFVSVSNGDIGHWREAGGPLAQRRTAEVQAAARILGIDTEVLDIHDGEILPTLEYRRLITRLIRRWQADLVITHRPNDYHPDHRYTSILVQDAAYMVTVPFFCPDVPALQKNPVFAYSADSFQKPYPFTPDVVISIDAVIEKKLKALDTLESQFYEAGANGGPWAIPAEPAQQTNAARRSGRVLLTAPRAWPANTANSWPNSTAPTAPPRSNTPRRSKSVNMAGGPRRTNSRTLSVLSMIGGGGALGPQAFDAGSDRAAWCAAPASCPRVRHIGWQARPPRDVSGWPGHRRSNATRNSRRPRWPGSSARSPRMWSVACDIAMTAAPQPGGSSKKPNSSGALPVGAMH